MKDFKTAFLWIGAFFVVIGLFLPLVNIGVLGSPSLINLNWILALMFIVGIGITFYGYYKNKLNLALFAALSEIAGSLFVFYQTKSDINSFYYFAKSFSNPFFKDMSDFTSVSMGYSWVVMLIGSVFMALSIATAMKTSGANNEKTANRDTDI